LNNEASTVSSFGDDNIPLQTKLRPPGSAIRILERYRLYESLNNGFKGSLSLVSASAGYGKSTLVAGWAVSTGHPVAWLTLDESESNFRVFLRYMLAAIDTVIPGSCPIVSSHLRSEDILDVGKTVSIFINEIDSISSEFALVLDDFHTIHSEKIIDFVNKLLAHPPSGFNLIIVSRQNPEIPLGRMRMNGLLTEIRQSDMRFTPEEASMFIQNTLGRTLGQDVMDFLNDRLEGWPAGMQLATLYLRQRPDIGNMIRAFNNRGGQLEEFFMDEVLSQLPRSYRDAILRISILKRFCPGLCEAIIGSPDVNDDRVSGTELVDWLNLRNFFLQQMDVSGQWFRFHHMFQEFLLRNLKAGFQEDDIADYRQRAGYWLEAQGYLEEALNQFIKADSIDEAVNLVKRNRHQLMNREEWRRLTDLLDSIPEERWLQDAELSIQQAYIDEFRYISRDHSLSLKRIKNLIEKVSSDTPPSEFIGEWYALQSSETAYHGDGHLALELASRALNLIPEDHYSARGYASICYSVTSQMSGNFHQAVKEAMESLDTLETVGTCYHTRILVGLCFVYLTEARPDLGLIWAKRLLELGESFDLSESRSYGRYFLGLFHDDLGDTAAAGNQYPLLTETRRDTRPINLDYGSFHTAIIRIRHGKLEDAAVLRDNLAEHCMSSRRAEQWALFLAFDAEINYFKGEIASAMTWVHDNHPEPKTYMLRSFSPEILYLKVLIADGSKISLRTAAEYFLEMESYHSSSNNRRYRLETQVLGSVLAHRMDDSESAERQFTRALKDAVSGRYARPFLEPGSDYDLLLSLRVTDPIIDGFRRELLTIRAAAFRTVDTASAALSNRELEVLVLLSERMSNKEITAQLFIALSTVERHIANIYRKLGVHKRRDAAAWAQKAGVLPAAKPK